MADATATQPDFEAARNTAFLARDMVRAGAITYEQAKERCTPYILAVNAKATDLARKHGLRPRKAIGFSAFVR